jgi:hypothetical protein
MQSNGLPMSRVNLSICLPEKEQLLKETKELRLKDFQINFCTRMLLCVTGWARGGAVG